jgi:hypothetical protein
MSNVTLLFDIHWSEESQSHSLACVGRLQPEIKRPVFPDYDLGLQYEVMAHTAGGIPSDMPPYNMDGWMMHETTEEQRSPSGNSPLA